MYYLRPGNERGRTHLGWLDSKHSFSFGHYYDSQHMGISVLRVINDDIVMPGAGFDTHGHRDMEIISYVLEGAIEHKDSMGQHFVVPAGEVQRMSAGDGVTHSEFNHSKDKKLRFLQIWIQPNKSGGAPTYEQKTVVSRGPLTALVTSDGREGSLSMQQDANIYRLQLQAGEQYHFDTQQRPGYLHIIDGVAKVNGRSLGDSDALGAFQEQLNVSSETTVTALWFDLPRSGVQ